MLLASGSIHVVSSYSLTLFWYKLFDQKIYFYTLSSVSPCKTFRIKSDVYLLSDRKINVHVCAHVCSWVHRHTQTHRDTHKRKILNNYLEILVVLYSRSFEHLLLIPVMIKDSLFIQRIPCVTLLRFSMNFSVSKH